MLFTLVLIVTHNSAVATTVIQKLTEKSCKDIQAKVQTLSGTDDNRVYSWCIKMTHDEQESNPSTPAPIAP